MRNPNILAAGIIFGAAALGATACSSESKPIPSSIAPAPSATPESVCTGALLKVGYMQAESPDGIRIFRALEIEPGDCAKITGDAGQEIDRLHDGQTDGDFFGACRFGNEVYATRFIDDAGNHGPWGTLQVSPEAPDFEACQSGPNSSPILPGSKDGSCHIPGKTGLEASDPNCIPTPSQKA
jgi:hypothetical protein